MNMINEVKLDSLFAQVCVCVFSDVIDLTGDDDED